MWKNLTPHLTTTQITLGLKITALIAATVALFSQDLAILFNDALQSETTSYLLAIPFLFGYLIYRKRKMLRAVMPLENRNLPQETRHLPIICGILLSITAMLLYWYGSYTFMPLVYHMTALPIFAAGLSLILFNPQTLRQLAFPIAFLMFLIPPPSEILYAIGSTLSVISSEASTAIVNAFGVPSTITSEYGSPVITIARPDGTPMNFTVDIACSGIYSLIGFITFAVFIAYIIRDKPWKKLALIALGIPLIYLLNIIRITILLSIGYNYGEQLALQIFHLLGGWILLFLGTLLLFAISEKIFKTKILSNPTAKCSHQNPKSQADQNFCLSCGRILKPAAAKIHKTDVIKIVAIAASVVLLMSIQAPVFTLTQNTPIVTIDTPSGQQVSTEILPKISNYTLSFFNRDTQYEAKANQDMSLIYLYSPDNESNDYIWATIEIATTRSNLHGWETCLITWPVSKGIQPKVTQIELKDIQLIQNPPIISRYFAFNYTDTNLTQVVLYWYETATFTLNSTTQQKQVEISLIAYPETQQDLPTTENQLIAFATAIANYWQPIETWSQITMILSQNGANLAAATSVILIAAIILYVLKMRKRRKANASAYQKLSKPNRQIINAILETKKTAAPTLDKIADTLKKSTGNEPNREQLLENLSELERTDIIESTVANKQDEPAKIWRAQITF
jgi:exosortase